MGKTIRKNPAEILIELKGTQSAPALDALVQRYFAMVYSTCLRITHDRHDAEDAAQAAFLCLARQMRDHKDIHAMGPWLYQVACNTSVDICRRRKRRAAHEPRYAKHESASVVDDPACRADLAETRPAVLESLNKLPTRYRLPLILHYFGGMSQEQLAKELACTRNALRVRLHRGHKLLRKLLEKRGVCLAGGLLGAILTEAVRSQVSDGLVGSTIALGRQVNGGLSACTASPDVLAAAAQAAVPVGRTKVWIVISLAVASALTASAPLFARLRDLPQLPNPLDLARFRLPELIAPILKFSSADAPSAPAPSVHGDVAPAGRKTFTPVQPTATAAPASFILWPGLLSPAAVTGQVARAAIAAIHSARHAEPDFVPREPVRQSQAVAGSSSLIDDPLGAVVRAFASSSGSGTAQPSPAIAATFQPATSSPWDPANAIGRGHGADYIGLAADNDAGGWLVYLDGSGGAVDALYATQFTGSFQLLRDQGSVSDALSSAITTAYAQHAATDSSVVQPVPILRNNGQVIADGRIENYTWCDRIQNDVDNPRGGFNGWFAMHGGRVELPAIRIQHGTHTYNWGESASDTTIDLINSMRITADASGDSELGISLLATDTAGLPPFPRGHHFISVYELSGGQTITGPMQTTVRYDDARLTYLGLNEQYVKLWYYDDPATGWQRAFDNFSRDIQNDWVSADIPAGVHYIAISTPEPASAVALLGTGALLLLRRNRQLSRG